MKKKTSPSTQRPASTAFRISPTGDDSSPRGPWASLAGARDALRALRASGAVSGAVKVEFKKGVYRISEPVAFGPEDSHTTYAAAPGAAPVIDGGRELTSLKETTHAGLRAWTVKIPEVASGELNLRSLFVAGTRRPRARYPKFSPDASGVQNALRIGEIRFPEKRKLFDGDHVFKPKLGDIQDWPSLRDAEIVLLHYWVETRLPQPHLDPETGWVSTARRSVFNLYESFNPKLARYYIDNLFEALTEPGEWYVNRKTGLLTYLPLPGETLKNTRLTIPLVTRFLDVTGVAFNRKNSIVTDPFGPQLVEGLAFEGLTFEHSDWYQPSADFLPHDSEAFAGLTDVPLGSAAQAAVHVPATVHFRWCRNCAFERNTVGNIGFTAIEIGEGCSEIRLIRNTLEHLGGSGVKIGGSEIDGPPADRTGHIVFADNTVRKVGRVFHQSCGIFLTRAFDCELVHNEIAHTCYTGVSVGWCWGYRETITRNILVENNYIHDICEGVLSDNGGIYLLGIQPGTVVRGNHICRVTAADYGGWGIYPDEGCSHITFEHNWIHDTGGTAFSIHYGRELIARHNVFARPGDAFANVGRIEDHVALNLSHNVLIGPAKASFSSGYQGDVLDVVESDANIYACDVAEVPPITMPEYRKDVPPSRPFSAWQKAGKDRLSVFTPLRVKETETTLVFPAKSPALAAGFKPYDWSICGPRPE
jgi:hypothetical protein